MCVGVCACPVAESCLTLCGPLDLAHQALLSIAFPRQEYQSGLPFLPLGDLSNPSPVSPELQVDSISLSHRGNQILRILKTNMVWSIHAAAIKYHRPGGL